jgi:acyl-CoA synthetase (AMP-forming)/AMP-acid ligase II
MDFATVVRRSGSEFSGNVAVWCDGREQTYAELYERASRLANGLAGLGLERGDRVALLGANGFETVEQVAGIALGTYIRTALYAHQTPEVNQYLLEETGARVLIAHESLVEGLACEHVITYGGDTPAYEDFLAAASPDDPHVAQTAADGHVIRFSSGTTGKPKGIYHTVGQWEGIGNEYQWVTPTLDERDVYLAAGPLTHAAVIFLWPVLQVGGRIAVMAAFEPGRALELIESQRASVTLMVPTMIQVLVNHPDARTRDLSSLRCLNYAASPISEKTMAGALDVFGDEVLYQMYGQSEAVPVTMLLPHQHRTHGRSVGRATPNCRITIVDDDGHALPQGETGEIAAWCPGGMTGMWENPEATAERMLPDGSILTRDIGYLDADGFLFLADRKEDMIISGGYNIWPAELENVLLGHAAVRDACVVGVPHEKWGETPVAVVVLEPGAAVEADELIGLTRERAGATKKVTAVEFADALPRSPIGKLLRREVRQRWWSDADAQIGGA